MLAFMLFIYIKKMQHRTYMANITYISVPVLYD